MQKLLTVNNCRECYNFMWGECDTGECLVIPSNKMVDPNNIDPRCPLPDAPGNAQLKHKD